MRVRQLFYSFWRGFLSLVPRRFSCPVMIRTSPNKTISFYADALFWIFISAPSPIPARFSEHRILLSPLTLTHFLTGSICGIPPVSPEGSVSKITSFFRVELDIRYFPRLPFRHRDFINNFQYRL